MIASLLAFGLPSVRTVKRWFTQRERNTLLPQISSPDMKMPPWLPLFMQYYGRPSKPSAQDAYRLFLPALLAAKALIDECINEWTEGSRTELKTLINAAFQVDKEGNISTARVLGLRRLQITDEKWQRAMDALSDSLQVHISKPFVRVYRRGEDGEYQLMNLDVAKV